jgi:hypothetical protein
VANRYVGIVSLEKKMTRMMVEQQQQQKRCKRMDATAKKKKPSQFCQWFNVNMKIIRQILTDSARSKERRLRV